MNEALSGAGTITDPVNRVLAAFPFEGLVVSCEPYGEGHINRTYMIRSIVPDGTEQRYILQKINTEVLGDPEALMDNISSVTAHIGAKVRAKGGNPERETLTVVPSAYGKKYYTSEAGSWRVYKYVEGSVCLQKAGSDTDFYESAKAFGSFVSALEDFPAETLHETIPHFHDTARRYEAFEKAAAANRAGRLEQVPREITFVRGRKWQCSYLMDLHQSGKIPVRGKQLR